MIVIKMLPGNILKSFKNICKWSSGNILCPHETTQHIIRNYAARKGTREKARKKKVKIEVKKVGFIPHNQRGKDQLDLLRKSKRINETWKPVPVDNVWLAKYYQWKVYSFADAVQNHRETHHPTLYNTPNSLLTAFIELDMHAVKKNRYVDDLNRVVSVPFPYDHGQDRTVLAFAKTNEEQEEARKAGATVAGGIDIIKDIQNGHLSLQDFQYVVAHPNILPELVSLRGIMKRKFPNPKNGTLGADITGLVKRFITGIHYTATKDEYEQDYAAIETAFGTLDMDCNHLEENLKAILNDVNGIRPTRAGPFITRCLLLCAPSPERLKLNLASYITENETTSNNEVEDENELEDDQVQEKMIGTA